MRETMKGWLASIGFTKRTFMHFLVIIMGSQFIYSINSLRTVLYEPFQQTLQISNVQLGMLFSLLGLTGIFAYIPATWFTDRFSSRKIISCSLLFIGATGWYMSTSPGYAILLIIFFCWGFAQDGPYWASVLKSVRCSASEKRQGTAFSLMELLRGCIEFLTNGLAILLFSWVGKSVLGMQIAMRVNGTCMIILALLTWFLLSDDNFLKGTTASERNKEAFSGIKTVLKMPECWLTGMTACGIYACFIGTQWFFPFLQNVYALPTTLAAIFVLFNTSGTRLIASPIGGWLADNKFGSSVNFMRVMLPIIVVLLGITLVMPKTPELIYPGMIMLIAISIMVYMLRSVYFAPIGEMNIPKSYSGAALSLAAMIGYSPTFWLNPINGWLLDNYSMQEAYTRIFIIMMTFAALGFVSATIMYRRIKRQRLQPAIAE